MIPSPTLPGFHNLSDLRDALRACIPDAVENRTSAIVECSIEIEPCDIFAWLEAQPYEQIFFWSQQGSRDCIAGAGAADILWGDTTDDLQRILLAIAERTKDGGIYYGGARFSLTTAPDKHWQPYRGCMFVLPRIIMSTAGEKSFLTLRALVYEGADPAAELSEAVDTLLPPTELPDALPAITARTNTPDRAGWERNIAAAIESFATGETEKIVLARRASLQLRKEVSPWALVRSLYNAVPNAYTFCFQPRRGTAFLGATPEPLYFRKDHFVFTKVVAGTRPRGATEQEELQMREELLHSAKDRHEHEIVRRYILDVLEQFGPMQYADETPMIAAHPRLLHLVSRLGSIYDPLKYSDADLLPALYPTPAVGGMPRDKAMQAIAKLEDFDRGWYAGTVGQVSAPGALFAVSIRSALIEADRLHLFSGAGIVPGSDTQAEWEEIELKLGNFLALLEPVHTSIEQELGTDDKDVADMRG